MKINPYAYGSIKYRINSTFFIKVGKTKTARIDDKIICLLHLLKGL